MVTQIFSMKPLVRCICFWSVILFWLSSACAQNNDIDSLKKALQTQKADTNKVKLLISLSNAYAYLYADTGVAYGIQAFELAEKLKYDSGVFWSIVPLSAALSIVGNYTLSLSFCFKALELAKKKNDILRISFANGILADSYFNLGDYNTCLEYEREVIKIVNQYYPADIYYMWIEMSRIFDGLHRPDSAFFYAEKAYEQVKLHPSPNTISLIAPILGNAFAGNAEYDSAIFYYAMGIPVAIKHDYGTDLVDNYNGIAKAFKAKGNLDSAIIYVKKILEGKIGLSYPVSLIKAANMLADIYESKEEPDSTLKYLRIAISLKDSLFSREKTIAIENLNYKEKEKQKEIALSTEQLKNKYKLYFLLAAMVIGLVAAANFLRNQRMKQVQNMRNSIAGDLHDDIGSTLTNISILSELSKQQLGPGANANQFLTRISEEVNTTSQALDDIVWSVNVRNDSIDEIILRMRRYAGELFDAGGLKYQFRFDDDLSGIKLSMDKRRDLYLIFKEAVNNIYKHANATLVTIDLNKEGNQIVMRIEDDGEGFNPKPSHRNGFRNMHSRAEKRKGQLQLESAPGKGTRVHLYFPIK